MGHGSSHHQNEAYDGSPDLPEPHTFRNGSRRLNGTTTLTGSALFPAGRTPGTAGTRTSTVRRVRDRGNRLDQGNPQPNRIPQRQLIRDREQSPAHPGNHPSGVTRPWKFDAILSRTPPDQATLEKFAWNPDDRSLNVFVKEDDRLTFHRHPIAQSTDCIRGKVGFNRGFHVWKITWPIRQRGTNAVIGVGTKAAPLHQTGYSSMVGSNAESYGWDL
uniref:B30.2/SPRY domain-containing protein n=1 Tax=Panagrolaimus sp. ES5 TaxID=591445 RepID=A0AC34GFL6_9BILA